MVYSEKMSNSQDISHLFGDIHKQLESIFSLKKCSNNLIKQDFSQKIDKIVNDSEV